MQSGLPREYFQTVFTIDAMSIDLPSAFTIVTAFNPMDRHRSPKQNRLADRELKKRLDGLKLEAFRIIGSSPDRSHEEPGWGFPANLEHALEIACEFQQRAIWWIDGGALYLVDCSKPEPIHVAQFSDRILRS